MSPGRWQSRVPRRLLPVCYCPSSAARRLLQNATAQRGQLGDDNCPAAEAKQTQEPCGSCGSIVMEGQLEESREGQECGDVRRSRDPLRPPNMDSSDRGVEPEAQPQPQVSQVAIKKLMIG